MNICRAPNDGTHPAPCEGTLDTIPDCPWRFKGALQIVRGSGRQQMVRMASLPHGGRATTIGTAGRSVVRRSVLRGPGEKAHSGAARASARHSNRGHRRVRARVALLRERGRRKAAPRSGAGHMGYGERRQALAVVPGRSLSHEVRPALIDPGGRRTTGFAKPHHSSSVSSSARPHASGTGARRRFSPPVSKQSQPAANSAATGERASFSSLRSTPERLSAKSTRSSSFTRRWKNLRSSDVGWTCHTSQILPFRSLNCRCTRARAA
jgi:hypothetical protein